MRRVIPLLLVLACGGDDAIPANGGPSSSDPTSGTSATSPDPTSTDASGSSASGTTGTTEQADSSSSSSSSGGAAPPYEAVGPYGVGVQTSVVSSKARALDITLWYPSETATGTTPLAQLVPKERQAALESLLDAAPAECVRTQAEATRDADVAPGPFPVVLYSHCYGCLGLSSGFIAERLASHGFIVVGVTHTGDTVFDTEAGNPAPLDGAFLEVRTQDVRDTLDAVSTRGPLARAIDLQRVGMFGHSFGATTTGKVLQDDDRFIAGVAIAAPIQNPLLPGVETSAVAEPMLYLLMQEDNSIQQIGNSLLRGNAMDMPGGSWLVELADAGHWSPSDLCGLVEGFMPCCGEDTRQTDGSAFTYLDPDQSRAIAAAYVTAFFALHLQDDAAAEDYLDAPSPPQTVTVTRYAP